MSHAHHETHHRLEQERREAWLGHPSRTGLDKHLRREKSKRWLTTAQGHLRCCHAWRGGWLPATPEAFDRLHGHLHAEEVSA